jgi:glycosyltransferase involved in cell wall biosynthesis
MRIALVATLEERVPPPKYGGIELVVAHLANLLVERGHKVYLLASGDSLTKAELIPIFPRALRKESEIINLDLRDQFKYLSIARILDVLKKIKLDLIHSHIGWRMAPFVSFLKVPTLITLHAPLDVPKTQYIYRMFPHLSYVAISNAQRKALPELNYVATIYNGIDLSQFDFNPHPKDYFAFLGRISPEKGTLEAIMAAKKAGVKLKIAAKIDMVDREYFENKIKPLIDGEQIEFIGEIGPKKKNLFLKNARALLAPIQWEEPFGLYFIEAMATGTPVIVFNRGSASEIVIDGKTGFVVKPFDKNKKINLDDFVKAIKKIDQIDRQQCRKRVAEFFTAEKMVKNYENLYYKLIQKNKT